MAHASCSSKESQLNKVNWDNMSSIKDLVDVDTATLSCGDGNDRTLLVDKDINWIIINSLCNNNS